jgi:hypothetical protein
MQAVKKVWIGENRMYTWPLGILPLANKIAQYSKINVADTRRIIYRYALSRKARPETPYIIMAPNKSR